MEENTLINDNNHYSDDRKMIVKEEFHSVDKIHIKEEPLEAELYSENTDKINEDLHDKIKVCLIIAVTTKLESFHYSSLFYVHNLLLEDDLPDYPIISHVLCG